MLGPSPVGSPGQLLFHLDPIAATMSCRLDIKRNVGTYCEEDEDITTWLCRVDLEHRGDRSMKIVRLRLRGVVDVYRVSAPRNWSQCQTIVTHTSSSELTIEDRSIVEVLRELLGIHGGT